MRLASSYRYSWVLVAVGFLVLFFRSGARSSLGLFIDPLETQFGWSRASISLAVSISLLLYAIFQGVTGWFVDRYGPRAVIALGALATGASTMALAAMTSLWQLYVLFGVVGSFGMAATAIPAHSTLISRWFTQHRARALSLTVSGMAVGQMLLIPLAMKWVLDWGWRAAFLYSGGLILVVSFPLAVLLIRDRPPVLAREADRVLVPGPPTVASPTSVPWPGVLHTGTFWSLSAAYFTCGFTVHFIGTHLVPLAAQAGIGQMAAASSFGFMGAMTLAGLLATGLFADRLGQKNALAAAYFLRGTGFVALFFATTPLWLYVAVAIIGFSFLITDPLTNSIAASHFGTWHLGTILGLIAGAHQLGGSLGAYLGGALFDWTGSYTPMLTLTTVMLLGAATLSWRLRASPHTARQPGQEPLPAG